MFPQKIFSPTASIRGCSPYLASHLIYDTTGQSMPASRLRTHSFRRMLGYLSDVIPSLWDEKLQTEEGVKLTFMCLWG